MKKLLLFIVVCLVVNFTAHAQTSKEQKRQDNMQKVAQAMQKKLGLTDEQTAQWKEIHANTMTKMKAIQVDSSLSKEQRRAQLMALHQENKKQVSIILTPEQQAKLKDLKEDMKAKWKEKRAEQKDKVN